MKPTRLGTLIVMGVNGTQPALAQASTNFVRLAVYLNRLADRVWTCDCGATLNRDRNAALNIERQALGTLGRSGFADQSKNGRGQNVRPFGAVLDEASKVVEKRRPSKLCQVGTVW